MSEERPAIIPEPAAVSAEPTAVQAPAAPAPETAVEPAAPPVPAEGGPAPEPAEEPSAEPALKPHTDEPGLLQATPEEQPKEAPEGEAAPEVALQPEPPAYEFALPEGFQVPDGRIDELTTVMREGHVSRETADKLWGMHTAAMQEFADNTLQAQHDAFAQYRQSERNKIAADPEYGGAGFETSRARANRMIDLFVPQAERQAFNEWLMTTGATDSHAFFRFLSNLAKHYDEPQGGPAPNPGAPKTPRQVREFAGSPPGRNSLYTYSRGNNKT